MNQISSRLLPDRFRSTEVVRSAHELGAPFIKRYTGFGPKFFAHLSWIKALDLEIIPNFEVSYFENQDIVEITMDAIEGEPLWRLMGTKGADWIYDFGRAAIQYMNTLTADIYSKPFPPGVGIVHKDFHMGNILKVGDRFQLVDIENIELGHFSIMNQELTLNILGDESVSPETDLVLFERLIDGLDFESRTLMGFNKEAESIVAHFYDYYREKKSYFAKEQLIRRLLVKYGDNHSFQRV